ncbi:helix-turn-helix domain-containing protein [Mycetohabitans sp. B5]|uniref:CRP/FNR family transcriptional regulator n=2 Tax=Burkholderiaceae TaxID=119060 RepID=A0A2P5KAJ8_9BURK|nr:helix-turn-helix domain-containing protein [Mycetohabitans sp. B5]PPB83685.1 CRP/FNR family transcriptional regulator [Mycetohabitans endofungorum]
MRRPAAPGGNCVRHAVAFTARGAIHAAGIGIICAMILSIAEHHAGPPADAAHRANVANCHSVHHVDEHGAVDSGESMRRDVSRCSGCALRNLCLPPELSSDDIEQFHQVASMKRLVRRGDVLYRCDDPFRNIFAIKTGSFKTVMVLRDGREQVTGFYLPGDALGLDGVCSDRHRWDAVALEDSLVCTVSFARLEAFCHRQPAMQRHLHRMLSGEIVRESGLNVWLGTMNAAERVAAFLLNLSKRFAARGYSPNEFQLRMTRAEMGSYLGLKLETVSRILSGFSRAGLVDTQGRNIRILNAAALAAV